MRTLQHQSKLSQLLADIKPLKKGFDLIDDHVVITDEHATILFANKAFERNTGFAIDEVIGKNPGDLWGGNMPKAFYERMWHRIKIEKRPFAEEVKNVRKNGVEYWQELHISPVLDERGAVKFFIGIEPNITDRHKKEEFRNEFIATISHQLNTPLAATHWTLDWLLKRGSLAKEQQQKLKALYAENRGLIDLITDLLVVSGLVDIASMPSKLIDIGTMIAAIANTLKPQFPSITFLFRREGTDFSLHGNEPIIVQVFRNIIVNATEYANRKNGMIDIVLRETPDALIFSCADNGIGIPEEEQGRIFTRFYRASNAASMKKTGTGFDLFIVKIIADSLGWRVYFQSKIGEGTVFFVEIPRTPPTSEDTDEDTYQTKLH